jgi:hypothetical protein
MVPEQLTNIRPFTDIQTLCMAVMSFILQMYQLPQEKPSSVIGNNATTPHTVWSQALQHSRLNLPNNLE